MTDIERPSLDSDLYEALWRYSNDLVSIIDLDGVVRYASPSYARTLGYEPQAIVGTTMFSRIHPDDTDIVKRAMAKIRRSRTPVTTRFRYRHIDGSWRVLEATGANHVKDATVQGVLVNSRDVTERVAAEEDARRQEARWRRIVESTLDSMVVSDPDGVILEANAIAHDLYGYEPGELIGHNLMDLVHPEWAERIEEDLAPLMAGGTASFTGLCRRKDGTKVWIEGRAAVLDDEGEPRILSMARSITERVKSFELLEQRVEERTRELSTLLDVSRSVASTLDLERLMSSVLDALQQLIGYDGASISVVDGDDLVIVVGRPGYDAPRPQTERMPYADRSPVWNLVAQGQSLVIDDVLGESDLAHIYREAAAATGYSDITSFRAWMGVPLLHGERVMGVLSLVHREVGTFSAHHAELVAAVGQQVAIAIENVHLYERALEAAALEERQRLSRELHDSVSQALYSAVLGGKTALSVLESNPKGAREAIEFTLSQAERGLAEMRALIFELRPESLEMEGLVSALQRQVTAAQARYETAIELFADGEPVLSLPAKEALYRIGQEALHNTVKHAGATSVGMTLTTSADAIILEVCDNGRGFNPEGPFPGHLGLQSMRERAMRLGGELDIQSEPGKGTTVRATVPREHGPADSAE